MSIITAKDPLGAHVWLRGERVGESPDDDLAALRGFTITWGRDSLFDPVEPSTLQITLVDNTNRAVLADDLYGAELVITRDRSSTESIGLWDADETEVVVWRGIISDVDVTRRTRPHTTRLGDLVSLHYLEVDVTAVDRLQLVKTDQRQGPVGTGDWSTVHWVDNDDQDDPGQHSVQERIDVVVERLADLGIDGGTLEQWGWLSVGWGLGTVLRGYALSDTVSLLDIINRMVALAPAACAYYDSPTNSIKLMKPSGPIDIVLSVGAVTNELYIDPSTGDATTLDAAAVLDVSRTITLSVADHVNRIETQSWPRATSTVTDNTDTSGDSISWESQVHSSFSIVDTGRAQQTHTPEIDWTPSSGMFAVATPPPGWETTWKAILTALTGTTMPTLKLKIATYADGLWALSTALYRNLFIVGSAYAGLPGVSQLVMTLGGILTYTDAGVWEQTLTTCPAPAATTAPAWDALADLDLAYTEMSVSPPPTVASLAAVTTIDLD